MPNIIGEPFPDYVNGQINIRQAAHGSGINTFRTPDQLTYLNSKTAWVKLAWVKTGWEMLNIKNPL